MDQTEAIKIAIKAMKLQRQKLAVNANLFRLIGEKMSAGFKRDYDNYEKITEAIAFLNILDEEKKALDGKKRKIKKP